MDVHSLAWKDGYSGDVDPLSGHVDPSVDFGLKKILSDKITVFF